MSSKKLDWKPRGMIMYDEHGAYSVVPASRKQASKIGKYHNALKKWRRTRDPRVLAPFRKLSVMDEDGMQHRFLTDPLGLARIFRSREARFESIYKLVP
jgi:hypothetical protein